MKIVSLFMIIMLNMTGIATAGPFSNEMSKCIVKKTNESDKTLLVQWVFAAILSNPDVEWMTNISSERKDDLNKNVAELLTDILTERCENECKQALEYEGDESFRDSLKESFGSIAEIAMKELITHSEVDLSLSGIKNYLDVEKIKKTFNKK